MINNEESKFINSNSFFCGFLSAFQGILFTPQKSSLQKIQKITFVQDFKRVEQNFNNLFEKLKIEYERN